MLWINERRVHDHKVWRKAIESVFRVMPGVAALALSFVSGIISLERTALLMRPTTAKGMVFVCNYQIHRGLTRRGTGFSTDRRPNQPAPEHSRLEPVNNVGSNNHGFYQEALEATLRSQIPE